MTDVFISYKREERARVEKLATALSDLDLKVWFDVSLTPGGRWSSEIDHFANEATALIVCWTKAALKSEWVRHEADIGIARETLVPLVFETCRLPQKYGKYEFIDLRTWTGSFRHDGFGRLISHLAKTSGKPAIPGKASSIADGREADVVYRTRQYLVLLAAEQATATYADAERELGVDLDTLIAALDEVAAINRIRREPPLCALVVAKKTGLPGRGFFQKHCFLSGDDDDLAGETFERLAELVFAHQWTLET